MSNAFVVGLTGPIGSGKTVVAKQFAQNGYMVIDADVVAREVVQKGSDTLSELAQRFGKDIINSDGTLDRKLLAQRAFASHSDTCALNDITHPAIIRLVKDKIDHFVQQGFTKIIYDAPLLFESGSDKLCDRIVTVIADKESRIQRVIKRDGLSEKEISDRIRAQHDDNYYTDKSDYVIHNDFSYDKLLQDTHKVILALNEVADGTFC